MFKTFANIRVLALSVLVIAVLCTGCGTKTPPQSGAPSGTEKRPKLRLAASIYVGWMPWFLAEEDGTLARKANESGVEVEFVRGDYIETINQFAAGGVDAVVLTNIDALSLLVKSNVQTDIVLIGSYSHGNDAILMRPSEEGSIEGKTLGLVEFSVSHYLLDRYLEEKKIPRDKVKWVNIADSEIAGSFAAPGSNLAGVVTWNPIALQIEEKLGGKRIYDSGSIEQEIADMLVVRRAVAEKHPEFVTALLQTWFEVVGRLKSDKRNSTLEKLGGLSGTDSQGYQKQLETTVLLDTIEAAVEAIQDNRMETTMNQVLDFAERHGLLSDKELKDCVSFGSAQRAVIHFDSQHLQKFTKARALTK